MTAPKNKIVIKRPDGAGVRILINPKNMSTFLKKKDALLNPDMKHLQGIPLERLKIVNGTLQKMTDGEFVLESMKYKPAQKMKAVKFKWRKAFDVLILCFMIYSLRVEIKQIYQLIIGH